MALTKDEMEKLQERLQAPTPPDRIEWLAHDVREGKDGNFTALAFAYVDARFIQERLDEVVGAFRWQSNMRYEAGLILIGIGIYTDHDWVWKWDTGQDRSGLGEEEAIQGRSQFSMGFKRAGYQWGMARDLYSLPKPRCRCRAYPRRDGKGLNFGGWLENPWERAESRETGRTHQTQVEPDKVQIPANHQTFFTIAFNRVKLRRDEAQAATKPFVDQETGEVDWMAAIIALEKNLPETDRHFTRQSNQREAEDAPRDPSQK